MSAKIGWIGNTTSDPSKQIGMPMGYDDVSMKSTFATYRVASLYDYSQVNLKTILKIDAPEYYVTYAETELLLAEAVVRGWVAGGAADFFQRGVRANMQQMAEYDPAAINETDIQNYLNFNILNSTTALEQINTQYWVASFMNGSETWANLRRSGFPALIKNPYPDAEITGSFICRMPYPDSETIANLANLNAAVTAQGLNDINTPVWWDK